MRLPFPLPTFTSCRPSTAAAANDHVHSPDQKDNLNHNRHNDHNHDHDNDDEDDEKEDPNLDHLLLDPQPRLFFRRRRRRRRPLTAPTSTGHLLTSDAGLLAMQRKIWVRRPGASPTRVTVHEDDLVDNVRDVILHKYANSLGKSIDAPDITLKIIAREQQNKNAVTERVLGPEESIGHTLDSYYPGGQTIDEALVIEVPQRRTPRPSPRVGNPNLPYYYTDDYRPGDGAREYFPPMALQSPHLAHANAAHHPSMAVLTTGQLPPLPSPGGHASRKQGRPKYGRTHTSSPTILHTVQPNGAVLDPKSQINGINAAPVAPLPTPPSQSHLDQHKTSVTPPNRASSPHPGQQRPRRSRNPSKPAAATATTRSANGDPAPPPKPASAGLLDGTVPPINVLIVEDNVINLKLLEAFMKRLKVRWKSAMNGKEAVSTWRTGGFHLVLMDIQLPVMNGLDATKEIRRLEGVNGIGVFSGSPLEGGHPQSQPPAQTSKINGEETETNGEHRVLKDEDCLGDRSLFKSPVIIVALTASSLQSDRHEALAAGCNDFLTKPVNFVWMERKVTEWGCMQALIDFDGWRKWKEIAAQKAKEDPAARERQEKEDKAKTKERLKAMFSRPPPGGGSEKKKEDDIKEEMNGSSSSPSSSANGTIKKQPTNLPYGHKRRGPGSGSLGQTSSLAVTLEGDEG